MRWHLWSSSCKNMGGVTSYKFQPALIYTAFHYSVLQNLINVFPSSALLTVLTPQTIVSGFFCVSLREWRTKGQLISCPTDLATPGSGTAVISKFRSNSLSLYLYIGACEDPTKDHKNLLFSDVVFRCEALFQCGWETWRAFWNENTVLKCIWINVVSEPSSLHLH